MRPLRLVLDTNVLLSALLFRGGAVTWLRTAWHDGAIRPLASRDTAAELLRVLGYPKFGLTAADREELLADYLPWCEMVTIRTPPPAVPKCRDLLVLAEVFPVPILTPTEMKVRLEG